MAPSKYWDDWVEPKDIAAMWSNSHVRKEWIAAGETQGNKIHMSRTVDGQLFLTQTELRAVAEIVVQRNFKRIIDPAMICAIAEIESHRQPDAHRSEPKSKQERVGIMQMLQPKAVWLAKEMGYKAYGTDWESSILYRPFVSIYFGAAYLKWLSKYENEKRTEEFMVKAYHSGPENITGNSSSDYWNKYLSAKQHLPAPKRTSTGCRSSLSKFFKFRTPHQPPPRRQWTLWEERASQEDLAELWRNSAVKKQWKLAGDKPGNVHFVLDDESRPYLTQAELKAVAGIIVSRHFAGKRVDPAMLCALAEITSKRFLCGAEDSGNGIMQIPFSTAQWLYSDFNFRFYKLNSVEDLSQPFVSMYIGAAYVSWLSNYQGRTRNDQFIVKAYKAGPQFVDNEEAGPFWLKYLDALHHYLPNSNTPDEQQVRRVLQKLREHGLYAKYNELVLFNSAFAVPVSRRNHLA